MKGFFECVPNFSEGRDRALVEEIVKAVKSVPGAFVLDLEMDADHNRTVLTFVGSAEACSEAAFQACRRASQLIDLNHHKGAHPRMGATDVVPFVPLEGATMEDAVELARAVGKRIGEELAIPVFLYESAATRPERQNLPTVRKGEFEGLRELIGKDPDRDPDFGPKAIHATAGATAVGARPFLIAYNLNLATEDVGVAKAIAKEIREKDGGFPGIRAMGFMLEELKMAQVSVNVVDYRKTSLATLTQAVTEKAAARGVQVHETELIGLAPADALIGSGAQYLKIRGFNPEMIVETRVAKAKAEAGAHAAAQPFLDAVAGPDPTPGGGSVSAFAGAQATVAHPHGRGAHGGQEEVRGGRGARPGAGRRLPGGPGSLHGARGGGRPILRRGVRGVQDAQGDATRRRPPARPPSTPHSSTPRASPWRPPPRPGLPGSRRGDGAHREQQLRHRRQRRRLHGPRRLPGRPRQRPHQPRGPDRRRSGDAAARILRDRGSRRQDPRPPRRHTRQSAGLVEYRVPKTEERPSRALGISVASPAPFTHFRARQFG